ncbi:hypothetical protein ACFQ1A_29400, partial [Massilia pinisoli]|uniref:hypothetical protein n=1 Tax=Massilia pinisoli TaxID=1772194 RepID=UPI00362CEC16
MKKTKHRLNLALCLLIACFNTFAQTPDEIIVKRTDLERCALYKRTNELLEREIKFNAVAIQTEKDSATARETRLNEKITFLETKKQALQSDFDDLKEVKHNWQVVA